MKTHTPILTVFLIALLGSPAWGQTGQWTNRIVPGPTQRRLHAMAYDKSRDAAILFGGRFDADLSDELGGDTWEWNGTEWVQRSSSGPAPRDGHAMTYDMARGVTVLFGGEGDDSNVPCQNCVLFGDTWEWNGSVWIQQSSSGPSPSPRFSHAMAYDSGRGVTVVFGGLGAEGAFSGETWEWDGAGWSLRSVGGPSPRAGSAMAYDSARGVTVLFGGLNAEGTLSGETWEWNGTDWTLRSLDGPSARQHHAMAYDTVRGVTVVIAGGVSGPNDSFCDAWEWDGTVWSQRLVVGPSWRSEHALVFDASRGVTVLFGGRADTSDGQTWELGCSGLLIQPPKQLVCLWGSVGFHVDILGIDRPFAYAWQWKRRGDPTWLPMVEGVNTRADVPQFAATGTQTLSITLGPPAVDGSWIWPNPGYQLRALVGNTCGTSISGPETLTVCIADFDCSGTLSIDDIFVYLNAWFVLNPRADMDGEGVSVNDIFIFFNAWFTGCS